METDNKILQPVKVGYGNDLIVSINSIEELNLTEYKVFQSQIGELFVRGMKITYNGRTQILYIKPKINGIYLGYELKLTVKELIQKKNYEFPLNIIGILKLSYNELDYNRIIQLEKVIAKFSFDITLHNIYEYSKGIFFVLNHNKDSGKKKNSL